MIDIIEAIVLLGIMGILVRCFNYLREKSLIRFLKKEFEKDYHNYRKLKVIIVSTLDSIQDREIRCEEENKKYQTIYNTLQEILNKVEKKNIERSDIATLLKIFG